MMHNHRAMMLLSVLCLSFLTSCNWSKPVEWLYFDRVKFTLLDEDKENQIVYLCIKEETAKATRLKAEKANALYTKEIKVITKAFADELIEQMAQKTKEGEDKDFSIMDGISMSFELQNKTEDLIDNIEEKHQCLLIDIIDQDEND